MIRATGAKLRMLASDDPSCLRVLDAEEEARGVGSGDGEQEVWDMIGCFVAVAHSDIQHLSL
jgi:hypothetical protein